MQRSQKEIRPKAVNDTRKTGSNGMSAGSYSVEQAIVSAQTTAASAPSNLLEKFIKQLKRHIVSTRLWIMAEQQTAVYQSDDNYSAPNELQYNTVTWQGRSGRPFVVFQPAGGGVEYPIRNGQFAITNDGDFGEWIAPQEGDYLIHAYYQLTTGGLTSMPGTIYIEVLTSIKQANGNWATPVAIAGASNVGVLIDTKLTATGMYLVRMERNQRMRFGLLHTGTSGVKVDNGSASLRIIVAKEKFHSLMKT